ncbi:hypothetical protein FACS1894122_11690 [Alphaproteobacteria bacterium]|nr:hypothetical protein FACS1894122_11690 [Alphaproteobacteria bacterium]
MRHDITELFCFVDDFCKDVSDKKIREIENKLNNRPRKVLNFKTPREVFVANRIVSLLDALRF